MLTSWTEEQGYPKVSRPRNLDQVPMPCESQLLVWPRCAPSDIPLYGLLTELQALRITALDRDELSLRSDLEEKANLTYLYYKCSLNLHLWSNTRDALQILSLQAYLVVRLISSMTFDMSDMILRWRKHQDTAASFCDSEQCLLCCYAITHIILDKFCGITVKSGLFDFCPVV
jgi:hypothetical protein